MSDRQAYTSLPRPSTSSFRSVSLSSPPTHHHHHPSSATAAGGGGFWGSISSVWTGLAEGFWRGAGGGGGGERVGEKRERVEEGGEKRKKRRVEQERQYEGEFMFDGCPPLMPPISQSYAPQSTYAYSSEASSSPVASRRSLSASVSPNARRSALRPYAQADTSYDDALMHAAASGEDYLPALAASSTAQGNSSGIAPPRTSTSSDAGTGLRSLSGRRKLSVQGVPAAPSASTSALAGRGYAGKGHGRTQSHVTVPTTSVLGKGVALPHPNERHVHFAPTSSSSLPSSTSLPNLASLSGNSRSASPSTSRGPSSSFSLSKSPASASKQRKPRTPQVANMLFGDDLGDEVARTWSEAKGKERAREEEERRRREEEGREIQRRREGRIRELEEEVGRLKGEISNASRPSLVSFPKSPRSSFPPPPPPPPPPPIGRPHPLLLSARQQLKATPPRPSASTQSKMKRRLSTLGGEGSTIDMGKFLEELGGKRGRLRKVGLPELGRKREVRREEEGGELGEILQRAFSRKFNGTLQASPSTPHLTHSRSIFTLSTSTKNPDWSSPRPSISSTSRVGLAHSRSQPAGLSSLSRSAEPEQEEQSDSIHPVSALPPQPVFTHTSSTAVPRHPHATSSTAITFFGQALSTDLPASAAPLAVEAGYTASISPSTSLDSLAGVTTAPPETPGRALAARRPSASVSQSASRSHAHLSSTSRSPAPPLHQYSTTAPPPAPFGQRPEGASPLPGLGMTRSRPVTPATAARRRRLSGGGSVSSLGKGKETGEKRERNDGGEEEEEDQEDEIILAPTASHSQGKSKASTNSPQSASKKRRTSASASPAKGKRTPTRYEKGKGRAVAEGREREGESEAYDDFEEAVLTGFGTRG